MKAHIGKVALGLFLGVATGGVGVAADEQFPGKQEISLYVGYGAGGGYDQYARLLARHLGRSLGEAQVVVKNMPGAGSLVAAHHLYSSAPKDGTAIALLGDNLQTNQLLGDPKIRFDLRRMTWIGRITNVNSVLIARREAAVKSAAELFTHQLVTGVPGAGSSPMIYLSVMNSVLGTRFKLVSGYRGSSDIFLALERGEVEATSTALWPEIKLQRPDLLEKVNIVFQTGLDDAEDLPGVPRAVDLAKTDEERQVMRIFFSYNTIGRSIAAPPDVPAARAQILRRAFSKTVASSELREEAQRTGLQVNPLSGEELGKVINEIFSYPENVVQKAKAVSPFK